MVETAIRRDALGIALTLQVPLARNKCLIAGIPQQRSKGHAFKQARDIKLGSTVNFLSAPVREARTLHIIDALKDNRQTRSHGSSINLSILQAAACRGDDTVVAYEKSVPKSMEIRFRVKD